MTPVEQYIAWIDSCISETKAHHNHKEMMAWVATAFYWPAIILVSASVPETLSPGLRVLLTIPLLIASFAVLLFIRMQFKMRWNAHEEITVLNDLRGKLLKNPELFVMYNKEAPGEPDTYPENQPFPRIPFTHLLKLTDVRMSRFESRHFLGLTNVGGRVTSERASYAILFVGLIIAFVYLWGSTTHDTTSIFDFCNIA